MLVGNAAFLAWSYEARVHNDLANETHRIKHPERIPSLTLISELDTPPSPRYEEDWALARIEDAEPDVRPEATPVAAAGSPEELAEGEPAVAGLPEELAEGEPAAAGLPEELAEGEPAAAGLPEELAEGEPAAAGLPGELAEGEPAVAGSLDASIEDKPTVAATDALERGGEGEAAVAAELNEAPADLTDALPEIEQGEAPAIAALLADRPNTALDTVMLPHAVAESGDDALSGGYERGESCVTFGPFLERSQALALETWLVERNTLARHRIGNAVQQTYYWIYLEPADADALGETIDALKDKGIENFRLIRSGNLRNAISLGLFPSQDALDRHLPKLAGTDRRPIVVPYRGSDPLYLVDARFGKDGPPDRLPGYYKVPVECGRLAWREAPE